MPLPENHAPICDFCSSTNVRWRLMAITAIKEFPEEIQALTGIRGSVSCGDWAACNICMRYIQEKKKTELVDRSYRLFFIHYPEFRETMLPEEKQQLRKELADIQDIFWDNWTGLVESIDSGPEIS